MRQNCGLTLTSEAVDIMASVIFEVACLVAVTVDCSDPRFTTTTALPRGDDGIAHTPVCQPARTAVVQPIIPGRVQLTNRGQLGAVTQTIGLGFPESETLGDGAMEHITFTHGDRSLFDFCLLIFFSF